MKRKISSLIIIFCLCILLISGTFALYKSSSSALMEVQLADWSVSLVNTEQSDNIEIISGVSNNEYLIKVKSLSDVTVKYSVLLSNLPDDVKACIGDVCYTEDNNTISFTDVGVIGVNDSEKTKEHTLIFSAPIGTTEVDNQEVNIDVKFEQVL